MLDKMTPEEKVGQLFLVTFTGSTANEKSQIYDLITHHHVGGVVLRAENDNFVAAPDTVSTAYQLIAQLQDDEWQASLNQPVTNPQHKYRYTHSFTGAHNSSGELHSSFHRDFPGWGWLSK